MTKVEIIFRPTQAFNLRMPQLLRTQVEEAAKQNRRSINSEIIVRLQRSFEGWKQL